MSEPVHFIHMTDLHVSHPDLQDPGLLTDTSATLDLVIDRINGMAEPPAFVVASGDLTNRGEPESYRFLKEKMSRLTLPVVYALGNHDKRPGFYSDFLGREGDPEAPYFHDTVIAGVHVIALDSSIPGRVSGTITDDQFDFLEGALASEPDLPKLLVIHHPPALDQHSPLGWESLDHAATDRLADMIRGRKVVGILSGHIHIDRVIHWHGVPVIVGTGQHNSVDFLHRPGLRILEGAGFAVCTLRPSGLTVGFVPLPYSRRELKLYSAEMMQEIASRA